MKRFYSHMEFVVDIHLGKRLPSYGESTLPSTLHQQGYSENEATGHVPMNNGSCCTLVSPPNTPVVCNIAAGNDEAVKNDTASSSLQLIAALFAASCFACVKLLLQLLGATSVSRKWQSSAMHSRFTVLRRVAEGVDFLECVLSSVGDAKQSAASQKCCW